MISLAIDVGKNTILNKGDIKWFRITFIFAAIGAVCEFLGVLFDRTAIGMPILHKLITFTEFSISPFLGVVLARSCGMTQGAVKMSLSRTRAKLKAFLKEEQLYETD